MDLTPSSDEKKSYVFIEYIFLFSLIWTESSYGAWDLCTMESTAQEVGTIQRFASRGYTSAKQKFLCRYLSNREDDQ